MARFSLLWMLFAVTDDCVLVLFGSTVPFPFSISGLVGVMVEPTAAGVTGEPVAGEFDAGSSFLKNNSLLLCNCKPGKKIQKISMEL